MKTSLFSDHSGRSSELRDWWSLPALVLFAAMVVARFILSYQLGTPGMNAAEFQLLHHWKDVLSDLLYVPVALFVTGKWFLRRQIADREARLQDVEQTLRLETQGLEECIRDRTSELRAEVEERKRADQLNRGRNQVLEMLARNEDLSVCLDALLATLTEQRSMWSGAIHLLEGDTLVLHAAAGIPDVLMDHLERVEITFPDAPEACAIVDGADHLMTDTTAHGTPWGELMASNGIVSAYSVPFFSRSGEALGTITLYARVQWAPSPRDLELVEMATSMAVLSFEHRRLQQELLIYAYHDELTGLPNRRLGEERLNMAIEHSARMGSQVAVLWIDLDSFKQINDNHGHPIGDLVLREVAARLSLSLNDADTVARMGGDEFMMVLNDAPSRQAAEDFAGGLHKAVSTPMVVHGIELTVPLSIGISMYPIDGRTAEQLKKNADQAMYKAKFEHVDTRSFSPVMGAEANELRLLKEELTWALKTGGFRMEYQPQCRFDGALVGFEALLRFTSPRRGVVEPSRFIPVVEEMGLIFQLGEWALRAVCQQSMEWQRAGMRPVPIAVNISALQFVRQDFASTVGEVLAESGLAPELLELELTESVVMRDLLESANQLQRLSDLGVRIAIDDFGTGYSSLSYLHQLPIHVLKIDRSFVERLTEKGGTKPIIEAVISMGHTLGLSVVAEGVQTAEQLQLLSRSRCDTMQGYYFSPALAPTEAGNFLLRSDLRGAISGETDGFPDEHLHSRFGATMARDLAIIN
jgi:diguanylate cyclase (GGDEF)-like protein